MEKKSNSLIPVHNKLRLIENQLSIGDKLLYSDNNFQFKRLIDIAKRNPIPVLDMVCSSYHFTDLEITQFKDKIIWTQLSANPNLSWSVDLIKKFKDNWNWRSLSGNKYLPWGKDLIWEYENNWNWYTVARNGNAFIEKAGVEFTPLKDDVREHLHFKELIKKLNATQNADKKLTTKRRYVNESENDKYIKEKDEDAHWKHQSSNADLDWCLDLLEKLSEKLDWSDRLEPYKSFQNLLLEILDTNLLKELLLDTDMPLKTFGESNRHKDRNLININKLK